IGPAASRLSYGGVNVSGKFDYAWNPYYGTWQPGCAPIPAPHRRRAPGAPPASRPPATACPQRQRSRTVDT
ncbi:chitinase, partial [Streptomyces olivaceus]